MERGRLEVKCVKSDIQGATKLSIHVNTDEEKVRIFPFCDLHIGAPQGECEYQKLKASIDYVVENPNHYIFLLGDMTDCAQKMPWKNRGPNVYMESMNPTMQIKKLRELLREAVKKDKVLLMTSGNHEDWNMELAGIDIIKIFAEDVLNVPYASPNGCLVELNVNKTQKYLIYLAHSPGGSPKTPASAATKMIQFAQNIYADAYMCGHTHRKMTDEFARNFRGKELKSRWGYGGNWLKWWGSYAQKFGLMPCPAGVTRFEFFADKHDVHVEI
jgi:UDP-2,3-diacylglucosamine pyrophosphatase LpxH